jgi:hypothetical protein
MDAVLIISTIIYIREREIEEAMAGPFDQIPITYKLLGTDLWL